MNTQRYRQQHERILNAIETINSRLNPEVIMNNTREVRLLISGLIGKLKFHLSIEDKVIYPGLLNHENSDIASTAQKFIDDMGDIIKTVDMYNERWSNEHVIKADPVVFIQETKLILNKLILRTEKENNELYKMVDELAY